MKPSYNRVYSKSVKPRYRGAYNEPVMIITKNKAIIKRTDREWIINKVYGYYVKQLEVL